MSAGVRREPAQRARAARVPITISEEAGVRYLHFGTEWVQGAMRIARPYHLEIEYVRQMMAWLLLLEPPPRILQLGLGAGSLTKFCHRRCPGSSIVAVERSADVVDAARRWFRLPPDDERLQVIVADAGACVADPAHRAQFGIVQVDLYDRHARGPVLDSERFYRACRRALASPGVMVVNLFGDDHGFGDSYARIAAVFEGRAIAFDAVLEGNRVVMAVQGPPIRIARAALLQRAHEVQRRYGLPATAWAHQLLRVAGRRGEAPGLVL